MAKSAVKVSLQGSQVIKPKPKPKPRKPRVRVSESDIRRLTLLGLPLKTVAETIGCSYPTVTTKVKELGIPHLGRKNLMLEVVKRLSASQQNWLVNHLSTSEEPIQDFIVRLISAEFEAQGGEEAVSELPVDEGEFEAQDEAEEASDEADEAEEDESEEDEDEDEDWDE